MSFYPSFKKMSTGKKRVNPRAGESKTLINVYRTGEGSKEASLAPEVKAATMLYYPSSQKVFMEVFYKGNRKADVYSMKEIRGKAEAFREDKSVPKQKGAASAGVKIWNDFITTKLKENPGLTRKEVLSKFKGSSEYTAYKEKHSK